MKSSLVALVLFAAVALLASGCGSKSMNAVAPTPVPALDAQAQAALTPDAALQRLVDGNARFVAGETLRRDLSLQVQQTAAAQHPAAIVLSCVDSRIPTERVFDQGIGDIFNARVAGNFVNDDMLGSMEFATKVAGAKLVVVMGHTSCGAVKGACDAVDLGHVNSLVKAIQPSVQAVAAQGTPCTSKQPASVDRVATHNVERTLEDIRQRSPILADLERSGAIRIVGAMYDVASGKVTFM
ncbi:MAG: carbonic anhydrase [Myxococcales bacterium]|nr:carbonic anhydrase [Myxococcales bacterium]